MSSVPVAWESRRRRVLAVDDDPSIRKIVQASLETADLEVWPAESGQQALEIIETRGLPHLAVIDIKMPGMTGLQLSAKIQEFLDLPIIMLTAVNNTQTEVHAINQLAEDYVTKPFTPEVLVARVQSLLRRIADFSYASEPKIQIDQRLAIEFARQIAYVDGRVVELTPTETKLLYILMRGAGHTLLTDYLLQRLWPREEVFEDALRTHVYRLRKKIEASTRCPKYVLTRRGLGYSFPKL